jgi:hypothetical protein
MSFSLGNLCGSCCGSIIEKLEKVTCNLNCCNRSSSTTRDDQDEAASSAAAAALEGNNAFDLDRFSEAFYAQRSGNSVVSPTVPVSVRMTPKEVVDHKVQWLATQLMGSSAEDMRSKLEYVLSISKVDLERKYKNNEIISEEETTNLRANVQRIKDYGFLAVRIWKAVRAHKLDWNSMIQDVPERQVGELRKAFRLYSHETIVSIISRRSFTKIDVFMKRIFIEIASGHPDALRKANHTPEDWDAEMKRYSSGDGMESSSRSVDQLVITGGAGTPFMTPSLHPRSLGLVASAPAPNRRLNQNLLDVADDPESKEPFHLPAQGNLLAPTHPSIPTHPIYSGFSHTSHNSIERHPALRQDRLSHGQDISPDMMSLAQVRSHLPQSSSLEPQEPDTMYFSRGDADDESDEARSHHYRPHPVIVSPADASHFPATGSFVRESRSNRDGAGGDSSHSTPNQHLYNPSPGGARNAVKKSPFSAPAETLSYPSSPNVHEHVVSPAGLVDGIRLPDHLERPRRIQAPRTHSASGSPHVSERGSPRPIDTSVRSAVGSRISGRGKNRQVLLFEGAQLILEVKALICGIIMEEAWVKVFLWMN